MPLHPCFRAHSSAAASSRAPAPALRSLSSTTSPFTSARISTSRSGSLLTCNQPMTPSFADSATRTACCEAGLIPRNRSRIWAAVAGYPSCPLSSAIRCASALFARRIFTSFLLANAICFTLPSAVGGLAPRHSSVHAAHPRQSILPRVDSACESFPLREWRPDSAERFASRCSAKPNSRPFLQNSAHHGLPAQSSAKAAKTLHPRPSCLDKQDTP